MIHRFAQLLDNATRIAPSQSFLGARGDVESRNPLIQVHDTESNDHKLAGSLANELINISGAELLVYVRTDNNNFDEVWEEDADPTYYSAVRIKGFFVPQPKEVTLTPWGVDTENQTTVTFSKSQVISEFGERCVRIGDVIEIPYNASGTVRPDRYRVLNAYDSGNFRFEWYYWNCVVENLTNDITVDVDFADNRSTPQVRKEAR